MTVLKSLGVLIATFAVVYILTPLAVRLVVRWLPFAHSERVQLGLTILATIATYNLLRRVLRDKMPRI